MARSFRNLALVCFVLAGAALGHAQSGDGSGAISGQFNVWAPRLLKGIFYQPAPNEAPVELRFYSGRSPSFLYRGPNPIEFFRQEEVQDQQGRTTTVRVPVASARLPEGVRDALIVFQGPPRGQEQGPTRATVFDDSQGALPRNSISVLNASGIALTGRVGTTDLRLEPAAVSRPVTGRGNVPIAFGVNQAGTFMTLGADEVSVAENDRVRVILLPPHSPRARQLQIRVLRDSVPPLEGAGAGAGRR
jgi:hypothetical protein